MYSPPKKSSKQKPSISDSDSDTEKERKMCAGERSKRLQSNDDELINRYKQAKEAVGNLRKTCSVAVMGSRRMDLDEEKEDESSTESLQEEDFVYVKRSIQEFLNYQVLTLEKTNAKLKMELQSNVSCLEKVSKRLALEQKMRGLTILSHFVERKNFRMLSSAFSKFKLSVVSARASEKLKLKADEEKAIVEKQKIISRVMRTQSAANLASSRTDAQLIAQLRSENRRLQLELEDRSRAAELLCKRLLRVDAAARSVGF